MFRSLASLTSHDTKLKLVGLHGLKTLYVKGPVRYYVHMIFDFFNCTYIISW